MQGRQEKETPGHGATVVCIATQTFREPLLDCWNRVQMPRVGMARERCACLQVASRSCGSPVGFDVRVPHTVTNPFPVVEVRPIKRTVKIGSTSENRGRKRFNVGSFVSTAGI